jgi:hypothetical protein
MKIKFLMAVLQKDSISIKEEIPKQLEELLQLNVRNATISLQQLCDTLTKINTLSLTAVKKKQQKENKVKLEDLGMLTISYTEQFPTEKSSTTKVNLLAMEQKPLPSFNELTNKNINEDNIYPNIEINDMKVVQTNTDTTEIMETRDSSNKVDYFCVSPHRPLEVVECATDSPWSPTPTQIALNDFMSHENAAIDSFVKTQNVLPMNMIGQNFQEMMESSTPAQLEQRHHQYQFQPMEYDLINNNQNNGYPTNSYTTYAITNGETGLGYSSMDPFIDSGQWRRNDDHRV